MHLNRSLALDRPEMQVPWFHEDFCRDILKSRKYHNLNLDLILDYFKLNFHRDHMYLQS